MAEKIEDRAYYIAGFISKTLKERGLDPARDAARVLLADHSVEEITRMTQLLGDALPADIRLIFLSEARSRQGR